MARPGSRLSRLASWTNSSAYHGYLLRLVPEGCERALDVGCGTGDFARLLAERVPHVDAVDRSAEMVALARRLSAGTPNVTFVEADVLDLPLSGYGVIASIASIHHMPMERALRHLRDALEPGGVLAVLGLHRSAAVADYARDAVAVPINAVRRAVVTGARLLGAEPRTPGPPILPPDMTLDQITEVARRVVPDAVVRRHLFFRYSLVYRARRG